MGIKFTADNTTKNDPALSSIKAGHIFLQLKSQQIWSSTDGTDVVMIGAVASIPIGAITIYDGLVADIPVNYGLCDGTSGTPDLRDRFSLGTSSVSDVKDQGGDNNSTMPAHTHTATHGHGSKTTSTNGDHTHNIKMSYLHPQQTNKQWGAWLSGSWKSGCVDNAGNHRHSVTTPRKNVTSGNAGTGGAGDNMPPYYTLMYIKRLF